MKILKKTLFISASLLLLAGVGCTQSTATNFNANNSNDAVVDVTPTNTNEAVIEDANSAAINDNIDTVVQNENASTAVEDDVDTSDWLSYTNEEYGFSFRYPSDWEVEENNQKCWVLTSAKTTADREQFYIDNPKAKNGTDAVPRNEMSLCVKDEQVDVKLVQWVEENTYRYIDEEYRGESTFNSLPAYLIVDLDFGKSSNYFLKVDSIVYSVYYEIVNDSRSEQIDLIAKSIAFKS